MGLKELTVDITRVGVDLLGKRPFSLGLKNHSNEHCARCVPVSSTVVFFFCNVGAGGVHATFKAIVVATP